MNEKGVPVAVVIPCHECQNTLGRAMQSLLEQTALPGEILLVDDGGDMGETMKDMAGMCEGRIPLEIIRLPRNLGPGEARNAGWDAVGQPYVAFLDADDSWHPEKLERQYAYMSAHPEILFCSHPQPMLHDAEPVEDPVACVELRLGGLLYRNRCLTSSVMLKSTCPVRFQKGKRYSEDYMLWLTLLSEGYRGVYMKADLAFMHKAPHGREGMSSRLWEMEKGEMGNFWTLAKEGRIGFLAWLSASAVSLMKYMRRIIKKHLGGNRQ